MDACKADGAEEPSWHEETGFVVVTFPFNKLNGMKVKKEDDPQNEPQNEPQNRHNRIASIIAEKQTISINEIARLLEVSRPTIKRDLKVLGYKWKGPSKTGHWER